MIGWMLFYFIHSFFNPLPWATCDNDWNHKDTCVVSRKELVENATTSVATMVSSNATTPFTTTFSSIVSSTASMISSAANVTLENTSVSVSASATILRQQTAAEEFWK